MTAKRVQAWAELASRDNRPRSHTIFVTASPAVFEHLLDRFPQARGPIQVGLDVSGSGPGDSNPKVLELLNALASAQDLATRPLDLSQEAHGGSNAAELLIYALAGVSPHHFTHRLAGAGSKIEHPAPPGQGPCNTLIGLMKG